MPFSNPGHPADAILNRDGPISGVITLRQLLAQRVFNFFVPTKAGLGLSLKFRLNHLWFPKTFEYPYGNSHQWNVCRYKKDERVMQGSQYSAATLFDDDNMHVAVLTQSVVQDMLWASNDVASFFTIKRSAYLIPIEQKDQPARGKENPHFYAIVPYHQEQLNRYKHAISHHTKNRTTIEICFFPDTTEKPNLAIWPSVAPSIDNAWDWGKKAKAHAVWEAELIENPKSIPELRRHIEKYDIALRVYEPEPDPEDDRDPRDKPPMGRVVPKTFQSRSTADASLSYNHKSWHTVSLLINPLIEDTKRKVEAVCAFQRYAEPSHGSFPRDEDNDVVVPPDVALKMSLHSDLLRGTGFYETFKKFSALSTQNDPVVEDITGGIKGMQIHHMPVSTRLPSVNMLDMDDDYREVLLRGIFEPDRERFTRYMLDRPLGLGILTAVSPILPSLCCWPLDTDTSHQPPGFGKTTAMAVATLGMVETFDKVYVSAPTHVAVDNFAARIFDTDARVVNKYNGKRPAEKHRRRKMIIRAYKLKEERKAFKALLKNVSLGDDARPKDSKAGDARWKLHLSLSYWMLKALESSAVPPLDEYEDPAFVVQFRDRLEKYYQADELGKFPLRERPADQKTSWAQYSDIPVSDEASVCSSSFSDDGILTPFTSAQSESGDVQPATDHERRAARSKRNKTFQTLDKDILTHLFRCLLQGADVVCTTPSLSSRSPFSDWRKTQAKAVAVDEAANMNRPDLYTVWGNTLLPCMLGGDDQQLQPTVLSAREEFPRGNFFNRHPEDGQMSPLKFLKMSGWPVFRPHWQFRMARGLFDLCQKSIYPNLPFKYAPSCEITLATHSDGVKMENYLRKKYPGLQAPADTDALLPVFFHKSLTKTFMDPVTMSRINEDQVHLALKFLTELVGKTGIDPDNIAVISPYKANTRFITRLRRRGEYPALRGMPVASTVDSFQGQERAIMVVIMGTNVEFGALFTCEQHRLNVMYSRQKSGLVVFGDLEACNKWPAKMNPAVLKGMYNYFKEKGRVVRLSG